MNVHVIIYSGQNVIDENKVSDLPKALLFAEEARGIGETFTIIMEDEDTTLFGSYRKGKGNLTVHEVK